MVLCLLHFPCGTTCLTIYKETGSRKWTAVAMALPTVLGAAVCLVLRAAAALVS
jgi:ferrous iron transport protein B